MVCFGLPFLLDLRRLLFQDAFLQQNFSGLGMIVRDSARLKKLVPVPFALIDEPIVDLSRT